MKLRHVAAAVAILFATPVLAQDIRYEDPGLATEVDRKSEEFRKTLHAIYSEFVTSDDVPSPERLTEIAIESILEELGDRHGNYLTQDELQTFRERVGGEPIVGIGAHVTRHHDSGHVEVVRPIGGSPAEAAGIKSGDLITHIGGRPLSDFPTFEDQVNQIRGPEGSVANLRIIRDGEVLEIGIVRSPFEASSVTAKDIDGYMVIQISSFSVGVTPDVVNALMTSQNADPKGIVLDLRRNPGGSLFESLRMLDQFLTRDHLLVTTIHEDDVQEIASQRPRFWNDPVVVLIDGGSASASEIVAGALQSYDRATVIGTPSYGKGTVQTMIPVGDTLVKMTTQEYFVGPNMVKIDGVGLTPDISIGVDPQTPELAREAFDAYLSMDPARDVTLEAALSVLREKYEAGWVYDPSN